MSNLTVEELMKMYAESPEIDEAKKLYFRMEDKAKEYNQLRELTYANYVSTVKNYCSSAYYSYIIPIDKANKWLHMIKEEKIDKRKKYEEKLYFDYVQSFIQDNFHKDAVVTKFYDEGFDNYCKDIVFKLDGKEYQLTIPNADHINTKNFNCTGEGRLYIRVKNGCCMEFIASSYKLENVSKAFKDYLNPPIPIVMTNKEIEL